MAALLQDDLRKLAAHYIRMGHSVPGDVIKDDLILVCSQIDSFLENNFPALLGKIDGKMLGLSAGAKVELIILILMRKVGQLKTQEDV